MQKLVQFALILLSTTAIIPTANAQIEYKATDISGSTWEYNYTFANNTPINPIGEVTIFYTLGQYSNLALVSSPDNWSSIVVQPDPALPADGFFDAQALDAGLAGGSTATGFAVEFTYLGQGIPGSQLFNIVDPNTYATLSAGNTTPISSGTVQAPEMNPGSAVGALTLLIGSLLVLQGRRLRSNEGMISTSI